MDHLTTIKARCESATVGPWKWEPNIHAKDGGSNEILVRTAGRGSDDWIADMGRAHENERVNNADFIAHARQDVVDLVAEVERLNQELAARRSVESQVVLYSTTLEAFFDRVRHMVREELAVSSTPVAPIVVEEDKRLIMQEAARLLGVCMCTVHQMKRTGKLPFYKVGGRVYIKESDCLLILAGKDAAH